MAYNPPTYKPGDPVPKAADYNALEAELRRLGRPSGSGGMVVRDGPGGRHFEVVRPEVMHARLTGPVDANGGYPWAEVLHESGGTWVLSNRVGSLADDPTYERNHNLDLTAGDRVYEHKRALTTGAWIFWHKDEGGRICIIVTGCYSGPLPGATVAIKQASVTIDSGTTDANGRFCHDEPDGDYTIEVTDPEGHFTYTPIAVTVAGATENRTMAYATVDPTDHCYPPDVGCCDFDDCDQIDLDDGHGLVELTRDNHAPGQAWSLGIGWYGCAMRTVTVVDYVETSRGDRYKYQYAGNERTASVPFIFYAQCDNLAPGGSWSIWIAYPYCMRVCGGMGGGLYGNNAELFIEEGDCANFPPPVPGGKSTYRGWGGGASSSCDPFAAIIEPDFTPLYPFCDPPGAFGDPYQAPFDSALLAFYGPTPTFTLAYRERTPGCDDCEAAFSGSVREGPLAGDPPVIGATVTVTKTSDATVLATTTTTAPFGIFSGTATIPVPPGSLAVTITVTKAGYVTAATTGDLDCDVPFTPPVIVLDPEAVGDNTIVATVRGCDNALVAGAHVQAKQGATVIVEGDTDAFGVVSLFVDAAGTYDLFTTKADYLDDTSSLFVDGGGSHPITIALTSTVLTFTFTVYDGPSGPPLVGAHVALTTPGSVLYEGDTDASGIFEVAIAPGEGEYTYAITKAGYATIEDSFLIAAGDCGAVATVELEVSCPAQFHGYIVNDYTSQGVPNAVVNIYRTSDNVLLATATTGPEGNPIGTYLGYYEGSLTLVGQEDVDLGNTFDGLPVTIEIITYAFGQGPFTDTAANFLYCDWDSFFGTIRAVPGVPCEESTIEGDVLLDGGPPPAGTYVEFHRIVTDTDQYQGTALCDAAGHYLGTIDPDLTPFEIKVVAYSAADCIVGVEIMLLDCGANTAPTVAIRENVFHATIKAATESPGQPDDGRPLEGATVVVTLPGGDATGTTNIKGEFEFSGPLTAGTYAFTIAKTGYQTYEGDFTVGTDCAVIITPVAVTFLG